MILTFENIGNFVFQLNEGVQNRGVISPQAIFNFSNLIPFEVDVPAIGENILYFSQVEDTVNPSLGTVGEVQYYIDFGGIASVKVVEESVPISLELCKKP